MLTRIARGQQTLLQRSSLASSSNVSLRHLSSALTRPSPIALGKRPAIASAGYISSRNISWSPFKKDPAAEIPVQENVTAQNIPAQAQPPLSDGLDSVEASSLSSAIPSTSASPVTPGEPVSAVNTSLPADLPSSSTSSSADTLTSTIDTASTLHPTLPPTPNAHLADIVNLNPGMPLEELLRTPEAIAAACTRQDLPSIGLDHSWINIVGWARDGLVNLHDLSGLPWWATIGITTIAIRAFLFRHVIASTIHNRRLASIGPQLKALTERAKLASQTGNQAEAQLAQKTLTNLFQKHDVNPLRGLKLPLMQLPIFLIVFQTLRGLAETPLPGFLTGGFGWITDLSVPDPYFVLPVTSVTLTWIVMKIGADGTGATNVNQNMLHFKNAILVGLPFFAWFASYYPAAMVLYWTSSNLFSILQALLLKQPWFQKIVGIKTTVEVAPPPSGTVQPDPTVMDTFRAIKKFIKDRYKKNRDAQMERAILQDKLAVQASGRKPGDRSAMESRHGIGAEVIRERKKPARRN